METKQLVAMIMVLATMGAQAAGDFPNAPPTRQEAVAQGLHRMKAGELKTLIPGTVEILGHGGQRKTKTYKPDGSIDVAAFEDTKGKWEIDETRNVYCSEVYRKKGVIKACYAVFRAPDGIHYFDYDLRAGQSASVWRRVEGR